MLRSRYWGRMRAIMNNFFSRIRAAPRFRSGKKVRSSDYPDPSPSQCGIQLFLNSFGDFTLAGDNHLIGMGLDFTKADPTPDPTNPDRTPFAPSPVLYLLTDEGTQLFDFWSSYFRRSCLYGPIGKILAYVFVKTDLPKDEQLKLPFMVQAAPIPATQEIRPFSAWRDLAPSVVLSAGGSSVPSFLLLPDLTLTALPLNSHSTTNCDTPIAVCIHRAQFTASGINWPCSYKTGNYGDECAALWRLSFIHIFLFI